MRLLSAIIAVFALAACQTTPEPVEPEPTMPPAPLPETADAKRADRGALNNITSILIDAEKIYADAADIVPTQDLKDELAELSRQRGAMAKVFQDRVTAMGLEPVQGGEFFGPGHRFFLALDSVFDDNVNAGLQATLKRENNLLSEVEQALDNDKVSAGTKTFLRWHLERPFGMQDGRDRVDYLISQAEKAEEAAES